MDITSIFGAVKEGFKFGSKVIDPEEKSHRSLLKEEMIEDKLKDEAIDYAIRYFGTDDVDDAKKYRKRFLNTIREIASS